MRIATRGSPLARWQAERVAERLTGAHPDLRTELVVLDSAGDRRRDVPVWEMGGRGVFVKEIQAAVLDGRADIAVHSAKDLPSAPTPGLAIAAIPVRGDPRDALVGAPLATLPPGAPIATGSVRRRAQLAWLRPDLTFVGVRGNIATRLGRVPEGGALVVAAAALERLGLGDRAAEVLGTDVMLPQVAQGALAVECRVDDTEVLGRLAAVDDAGARAAVTAERAYLARLGGGCDRPVGAHARCVDGGTTLVVEGLLATSDGRVLLRRARSGPSSGAAAVGTALAEDVLAAGGGDLIGEEPGALPGAADATDPVAGRVP